MKPQIFVEKDSHESGLHDIQLIVDIAGSSAMTNFPDFLAYDDVKISIINYVIQDMLKQLHKLKLLSSDVAEDIRYLVEDYLEKGFNSEIPEIDTIIFDEMADNIY